jgi:hypothetical protein
MSFSEFLWSREEAGSDVFGGTHALPEKLSPRDQIH